MVGKKPNKKGTVKIPVNRTKDNVNKKYGIIVLDLDETLFHTDKSDVHFRPKVIDFLVYLNKHFYLVVYTAALKTYADKILDKIKIKDNITAKNLFILKLYRNSCTPQGKDLRVVLKKLIAKKIKKKLDIPDKFLKNSTGLELNNIVLVDNLVENFLDKQFFNGIPIKDFYQNDKDKSLVLLKNYFKQFIELKKKNKNMNLRNYLYNNLYKLNSILKIKYNKCKKQ